MSINERYLKKLKNILKQSYNLKSKKEPFPNKLKIFASIYHIKYHKGLILWPTTKTHLKEEWVEGYTDFDKCLIYVNNDVPYIEVWNTLWHEIGHAVVYYLRSSFTKSQEEHIMNMFALGCTSVIFDNKLKFDFTK